MMSQLDVVKCHVSNGYQEYASNLLNTLVDLAEDEFNRNPSDETRDKIKKVFADYIEIGNESTDQFVSQFLIQRPHFLAVIKK